MSKIDDYWVGIRASPAIKLKNSATEKDLEILDVLEGINQSSNAVSGWRNTNCFLEPYVEFSQAREENRKELSKGILDTTAEMMIEETYQRSPIALADYIHSDILGKATDKLTENRNSFSNLDEFRRHFNKCLYNQLSPRYVSNKVGCQEAPFDVDTLEQDSLVVYGPSEQELIDTLDKISLTEDLRKAKKDERTWLNI